MLLCLLKIGLKTLHESAKKHTKPKTWPVKVFSILQLCKDQSHTDWLKRLETLLIDKFMFKMDPLLTDTLTKSTKNKPNHKSAYEYAAAVDLKVIEQLDNGAMFCDDDHKYVKEPKQDIPLKIVPQKTKLRLVKNYSDPYDVVSVNSLIPDDT